MMLQRLSNFAESGPDGESTLFTAVPVAAILCWPDAHQKKLRLQLARLFQDAFPRMSVAELRDWVEDYFRTPPGTLSRDALLLADEGHQLVATTLFDHGPLVCGARTLKGVYIVDRAVSPPYQRSGVGRKMATEILSQLQPDILITTCTGSASLHSWISAVRQGFAAHLEVFPRWEHQAPRPFPAEAFDLAVCAFRQLYLGVAHGSQDEVDRAVARLSRFLVRKGIYAERYDTHPWEKAGRKDLLAEALGAGIGDGMLLVVLRKGLRTC